MANKTYKAEKIGYSDIMYRDYVAEVEASGIFESNIKPKVDSEDDVFQATLKQSKYLARTEFKKCHKEIVTLFEKISFIENNMAKDLTTISNKYDSYEEAWHKIFDHFNNQLLKIFTYAQNTLIVQFSKKVKRMDNFCICLFGRTKAGKSTTMEALTEGDGKSIGIGKQNTTQDVKEYQWKDLLIVDTPGIDAMDRFEQLESMALSYADDSDLIVFLMPHQIEEGDFDKFARFYKQNKPILILLNVKKEIGSSESLEYKMFLKHPEDVLDKSKISGYEKRIEDFILEKLGIKKNLIPIIPVHSASAFASLSEEKAAIRKKLYTISNFDELKNQLIKEVKEYGKLYRIKNPYDSVDLFAREIVSHLQAFDVYLRTQKDVFEESALKFEALKSEIIKKRNDIIKSTILSYFDSKKNAVPQIVDRLFSEKSKEKRDAIIKEFVPDREVKSKVESCRIKIVNMIKKEIKDFFDQLSTDLKNMTVDGQKASFTSSNEDRILEINDIGEWSDIFEGISFVSSVLLGIGTAIVVADVGILGAAGTLFGIGSANIWNPVGWGLLAGSLVTGFLGLFARKKQKDKIREAKLEAKSNLEDALNKGRKGIKSNLDSWTNNIISEIETKHIDVMNVYVKYANKYLKSVEQLNKEMKQIIAKSQKRKYAAMIKCITDEKSIRVYKIEELDAEILLHVGNKRIRKAKKVQNIMSRVEEKEVIIKGG